jgi:hypothetical protein
MNDFPAPDYAEEINSAYAQGCAGAEAAVAHIVRCGALLIAQKGRMKHGEFMPWVEKHCKFSHDSANHYMRVAANPNYEHARNLSLRQLLDKPKPKPPPPTTPQRRRQSNPTLPHRPRRINRQRRRKPPNRQSRRCASRIGRASNDY